MLRAEATRLGYTRQFTIYDQADARRLVKQSLDAVVESGEDLRAGGLTMGLRVRWIGELAGHVNVVAVGQAARGVNCLPHPAERLDQLDARTVLVEQRAALSRHADRQRHDEVVALSLIHI